MFKIVCLKCGKEAIITIKKKNKYEMLNYEGVQFEIYGGYDGEIAICCPCGNEIFER